MDFLTRRESQICRRTLLKPRFFHFLTLTTKLTFGTAGIKKLDKVISTYKIPDGEQIVAYMKGTIPLFGLTTEGTIITDCALYIHPCHDDGQQQIVFHSANLPLRCYMKDPSPTFTLRERSR